MPVSMKKSRGGAGAALEPDHFGARSRNGASSSESESFQDGWDCEYFRSLDKYDASQYRGPTIAASRSNDSKSSSFHDADFEDFFQQFGIGNGAKKKKLDGNTGGGILKFRKCEIRVSCHDIDPKS
jgi:hypothetical protein